MPTSPRQNDVQRGEEHRPPVPAEAPAVRRLGPAAILALQRTAGNQAVARYVTAQLRRPPQRPKLPPASDQASPENRQLAGEIDDVDRLDDAALDKRRAENATQVAATDGAAHADAVQKRDALEYVTSHRRPPGPKLDVKQWRYVRNDQTKRRQFLNALVAERAHEDGSFESAMQGIMFPDPLIVGDLAVIRADADRFKREFKGQARINAERMLRHSNQAIAQLLTSYGIPTDSATIAAERILKGGGVAEEAAAVIRSMKRTADDPGGANEAASTTHRLRLAQWVERIKTHQARARDAAKASNLADMNVSVASTPADQVALNARKTLRRERDTLAGLWIQAERAHPVLAAYRTGDRLEKIELGGLDSHDVDTEMQTVLERVLPKVVSIARAHALIRNGTVSPLSLTPVVAMTRANMFVPPGSIRAAIVRDLLEEAEDGQSALVMLLSFALVLVTLVPSGGASLGIAAGVASAGLATYSALQEFQTYENNKTLIDTDLDRARALSDEEPSLAGFAMSLVGIGLEGLLLVQAFKTAVQIRRMAMAGDRSKRLQDLLDELNEIGKKHNQPDLGKQVLDDAASAKPRRTPGDAEATQDMPAIENPALRRPPVAPPRGVPDYNNRDEVREAVTRRLLSNLKWGDGTMLPKEYGLLDRALAQNVGENNTKITKALPHVVKGLRDPELYGEVMADAWALAQRPPGMDINAALEQMAQSSGAPIRYIEGKEGVMDAAKFFKKYAGQPGHFIDLPLVGDAHGAMSHLVQDLVVDRALRRGRQGMTGAEFRGLLGQAEGSVALDAGFATKTTTTFLADETKMRTGDYLWRMLYDNTGRLEINRPEELGDQLFLALGIR